MRLKNKKTGEIVSLEGELLFDNEVMLLKQYSSLAELNEEWEDAPEEPKEYWHLSGSGEVRRTEDDGVKFDKYHKEVGNYFETREEAEKAVKKLKAWKRLKDKGFRFTGINDDEDSQELITQCGILCEADIYHLAKDEDFLLLFGGKE